MSRRFFVTGTDTGVGKTVLSALLCIALDALYWKPVQTGTDDGTDRETVMTLAEIPEDRTAREVYRFAPPVSPHLAARWAGVEIEMSRFQLPERAEGTPLIVEGAGGVLAPLNATQTMRDLMAHLRLPVLLASRSSLGTINQTTLSLEALRAAEIPVAGVVMIGELSPDNREAIESYGRARVVGEIPRLGRLDRAALLEVFRTRFSLGCFR